MAYVIKRGAGCCNCADLIAPCNCGTPCGGIEVSVRGGLASVCGYPEYINPSVPPTAYRRKRKRRRVVADLFTNNSCTSPLIGITANASGTAPVSGVISGVARSGTLTYSVLDEAFSASWSGTFGSYGFVAFFRPGETEPWDGWTRASTRPVSTVGTYTMRACMTDTGDFPGPPDPGRYVLGASLGTYVIGPKSISSDTTDEQSYTPGTCIVPEDPLIPPDLDPDPETPACAYVLSSRSRVELRYDGTDDCCFNAATGNFEKHSGFLIDTLLDPDTDEAAIERLMAGAGAEWGPWFDLLLAPSAAWQSRGPGMFDFVYRPGRWRASQAAPIGTLVTFRVKIYRRPYGLSLLQGEFFGTLVERAYAVWDGVPRPQGQPLQGIAKAEGEIPITKGWETYVFGCTGDTV